MALVGERGLAASLAVTSASLAMQTLEAGRLRRRAVLTPSLAMPSFRNGSNWPARVPLVLLAVPALGVARLLPAEGAGLGLRLGAATACLLIPGALISRALRLRGLDPDRFARPLRLRLRDRQRHLKRANQRQ